MPPRWTHRPRPLPLDRPKRLDAAEVDAPTSPLPATWKPPELQEVDAPRAARGACALVPSVPAVPPLGTLGAGTAPW